MRLLLVEDDPACAQGLRDALRRRGHTVDWLPDARAADATLASERFDLVLLEPGRREGDGLHALRGLRARGDATPVIVVSACDGLGDRIAGLDAGADDYVAKPFALDELLARMRAVERRRCGRAGPVMRAGAITLEPATRRVCRDGRPVALSAREYALLEALMQRPGAILSRAQLEDRLYGWGEEPESNAISVYVHQLRRKLGEDLVRTVRGVGYRIEAPPEER